MPWILVFLLFFALPVAASEPQLRGQFKDWLIYDLREATGPTCYAMTRANKTTNDKGKNARPKSRGQVLLQVTRRPAESSAATVSFVAGQRMKPGSTVRGQTDRGTFVLKPDGDTAWTAKPSDDARIIQMLRAGKWLTLTHTDRQGRLWVDHFSLNGTSAAQDAIGKCG